ncbi:hypothetical protein HZC53_01575 [Candidatus Uhrbacteria bacterium]|nr:hypothetical protein [Candidatus Uhrbacteria bacterium]
MKIRKIISRPIAGLIVAILTLPAVVSAASPLDAKAKQYGFEDQMGGRDIPQLVARIINWVLPLTGSLLLVMFLYGGFLWMTAAGEADKVKKATQTMTNAVIGMVIIVGAYAIVYNLTSKFGAALSGTP